MVLKNIFRSLVIIGALLSGACSAVAPDAGQEAVLIDKPFFFGHGGVRSEPVKSGLQWKWVTTGAVYVDTRPKQQQLSFDDLFTSDGVPLDFHASVQYSITDSVSLVQNWGSDDTPNGMGFFIRTLMNPFAQIVRDAVKKHGLNEMAINVSAADAVDAEVTARFIKLVEDMKVPINVMNVTLGRANPPDAVKHQRIATAEQEQRVNTERQRKLAEDQRKDAELSRAAADNAYREAMRLSPDQFLQLEYIKTLDNICRDGKCTFINGQGAVPTLSVK